MNFLSYYFYLLFDWYHRKGKYNFARTCFRTIIILSVIASFITYIILLLIFDLFSIKLIISKIDSYFAVFVELVYYLVFYLIFAKNKQYLLIFEDYNKRDLKNKEGIENRVFTLTILIIIGLFAIFIYLGTLMMNKLG
jgi:hypothetical protein